MSVRHQQWVDSWMAIRAKIEAGTMTVAEVISLVHKTRFRNTLGKKRQRAKIHLSGPGVDSKTMFDTTLVAENCQRVEDLSPLAIEVADGVIRKVTVRYEPERVEEQTGNVAYISLRIKSLRPKPLPEQQ